MPRFQLHLRTAVFLVLAIAVLMAGFLVPRKVSPHALEPILPGGSGVTFNENSLTIIEAQGGMIGYGWPLVYSMATPGPIPIGGWVLGSAIIDALIGLALCFITVWVSEWQIRKSSLASKQLKMASPTNLTDPAHKN